MVRQELKSLTEKSPEGWEGTVKALKKHGDEVDNPWALAHWMKEKGYKSHKESVNEAGGVVTARIQQKPRGYWAVFNKKANHNLKVIKDL